MSVPEQLMRAKQEFRFLPNQLTEWKVEDADVAGVRVSRINVDMMQLPLKPADHIVFLDKAARVQGQYRSTNHFRPVDLLSEPNLGLNQACVDVITHAVLLQWRQEGIFVTIYGPPNGKTVRSVRDDAWKLVRDSYTALVSDNYE